MLDSLTHAATAPLPTAPTPSAARPAGGGSFADSLRNSIDEVAKMQNDAGQAVTDLATGRTGDLSGVMTAVEKGDLAFKTLLAIRSKLVDAYDELKSMPI